MTQINLSKGKPRTSIVSSHFSTDEGTKLKTKPVLWGAEIRYIKKMLFGDIVEPLDVALPEIQRIFRKRK